MSEQCEDRVQHRGVLIIHPRVAVSDDLAGQLRDAGYVLLRARFADVRLTSPIADLDGALLTAAAWKALRENESRWKDFGREVLDRLIASHVETFKETP